MHKLADEVPKDSETIFCKRENEDKRIFDLPASLSFTYVGEPVPTSLFGEFAHAIGFITAIQQLQLGHRSFQ